MSHISPSTPSARRPRPRRIVGWAGGVGLLAAAALLAAALIPGSHAADGDGQARSSVAGGGSPADALHREARVYGSNVAASRYGTQAAARENGVSADGRLISDLSPLKPWQFAGPVARYKAYAERWADRLGRDVTPLTAALRAGDRAAARRAWTTAFSDYLCRLRAAARRSR